MILHRPEGAWCLYVIAHGAGAGMRHPFLEALAGALAGEGVATLRYEPPVSFAIWRSGVGENWSLSIPIG